MMQMMPQMGGAPPMMGSPMMAMAAQAVNPMMAMMGNFFGGNTVNMNVRLGRQVFFPGNVVEGVVELTVSQPTPVVSVNLIMEGHEAAIVQHIDRVPDGFIDHPDGRREQKYKEVISMRERSQLVFRQVITLCGFYVPGQDDDQCGMLSGIFGSNMPNRATVTLPPGVWSYPFRLQLPQQLPPTYLHNIDFGNLFDRRDRQHNPFRGKHEFGCGVAYWLMGHVDVPTGGDVTRRTPIMVVNMVPQSQYQAPCAVSRDQHFDLSCCCCISKGSCDAKIGLSRTLIALDRDQITITADVDNTKGEAKLNALHCSLTSRLTATVLGEGTKMTSKSAGSTSLSLGLEPGKQKSVQGTMNLDASAVPTFRGAFTQSEYTIAMVLDVDWASDEGVSFPVYVVQSVDPTNQFGMQFNASGPGYNAGMVAPQQYYYQPPQGAAGFNPAPCGPPPPTAVMLPPPQQMNTNMPPPMFQPL